MLSKFARSNKQGRFYLGDKEVTPGKITLAQWEQLFEVVESLPQLIYGLITAPQEQRVAYAMLAFQQSLHDITAIVSTLTGIDREYIYENASVDQLFDYFAELVRINDFARIIKNVKSVLATAISGFLTEMTEQTDQDAN